jgi:thiamine biosynthesis lipoprotein
VSASRAVRGSVPTLIAVIGAVACAFGSGEARERHEFTEVHMGVPVRLVVHARTESEARSAARAAYARVADLEDKMSDYRADSEVRRLERVGQDWIHVSPELFAVLARARDIALLSGGAFDATVGPLVALWRGARRTHRLPTESALAEARARVGWRALELDSARGAVRLARTNMQLDLGGIAKGFILEEALAELRARGLRSAMIEAGGDLVVGDAPPGRGGWRVAIGGADTLLTNVAVATSGSTEQFVEIAGIRYSHVIDPRTGLGVQRSDVVTVLAPDGATADAAATALSVLGREAGGHLIGSSGVLRVYWTGRPPTASRP